MIAVGSNTQTLLQIFDVEEDKLIKTGEIVSNESVNAFILSDHITNKSCICSGSKIIAVFLKVF